MTDIDYQRICSAAFIAHHNYILSKDENDHTYTDKDDEIWWIVQEAVKHAMPKSDDDPYRAKAVEILELDMEEFGDDKAINLTGLYKLLCGDDGYLAIPNEQYFSVIESTPQPSTDVSELVQALQPIVEAVGVNDRDSLCGALDDSHVIWTASGSWESPVDITLGDLRKIAKHTVK